MDKLQALRIFIGWSFDLRDALVDFVGPDGRTVRRWSSLSNEERRWVRLLATDPAGVLRRLTKEVA